jgi:hypothetical protein
VEVLKKEEWKKKKEKLSVWQLDSEGTVRFL